MTLQEFYEILKDYHLIHGHPLYLGIQPDGTWEVFDDLADPLPIATGNDLNSLTVEVSKPPTPDELALSLSGIATTAAATLLIVKVMKLLGYQDAMEVYEGIESE